MRKTSTLMKALFDDISQKASKMTTKSYSTSFSLGIRFLHHSLRAPIYSIYGFVRFADEIVDSFHDYDKSYLLDKFKKDTFEAIETGISLNPILNSFQWVVNKYNIDHEHIHTFLKSMEMDLHKIEYSSEKYEEYILGSAEVVGLMCLKIFVNGDQQKYDELEDSAKKLGAAFQKINFLRDLKQDYQLLGRTYFPGVDFEQFDGSTKKQLEHEIAQDFADGYKGILKLPKESRFGVYMAYIYYINLFNKIKKVPAEQLMQKRVRIPNNKKYRLFMKSYLKHNLNLI